MAFAWKDSESVAEFRDGDVVDFAFAGEWQVHGIFVVEGDGAEVEVGELAEDLDDVSAQHHFGAVLVGYQAEVLLFLFLLLLTVGDSLFLEFRLEGSSCGAESRYHERSIDIVDVAIIIVVIVD